MNSISLFTQFFKKSHPQLKEKYIKNFLDCRNLSDPNTINTFLTNTKPVNYIWSAFDWGTDSKTDWTEINAQWHNLLTEKGLLI